MFDGVLYECGSLNNFPSGRLANWISAITEDLDSSICYGVVLVYPGMKRLLNQMMVTGFTNHYRGMIYIY